MSDIILATLVLLLDTDTIAQDCLS